MSLDSLSLLVAEIPLRIKLAIEHGEVDFATYNNFTLSTTENLHDKCFDGAIKAIEAIKDESLEAPLFCGMAKGCVRP